MGSDGSAARMWSGLNYPSAIATGPDRKLWLTGSSQDVVARVSTAGQGSYFSFDLDCERASTGGAVSRFRVPTHFFQYPDTLAGIVQRPDSTMWFTEYAASRIGRLSLQ